MIFKRGSVNSSASKKWGICGLLLGFLNGPSNYGPRFTDGELHEKYAIVGMPLPDADGNPVFHPRKMQSSRMSSVIHSPILSWRSTWISYSPPGEKLYAAKAPAMKGIGYQNWQSLMYESAVRACVASYIRDSFKPEDLQDYLCEEACRGFVWTRQLSNLLQTYEGNRDKYPTFESFFPEFIARLNDYTAQVL